MTSTAAIGLTHIVLMTPQRRVDLSLPQHVPLAHLQPALLRHGGEALVEDGVGRGGWVVRRIDGTALDPGRSLSGLGVHNGDVLLLSYRDQQWPEPAFDDLADGVADDASRLGPVWRASTTRWAGLLIAATILTSGLLAVGAPLVSDRPAGNAGWLALTATALLTGVAAILARLRDSRTVAAVLGAFGLGYAALGGLLVLATADPGAITDADRPWQVLTSGAALLLASICGLIAIAVHRAIFYGGATLGLVAVLGSLLAVLSTPVGGVAATAAALILLAPLLPRFAAHQGGLPSPTVPSPAHGPTTPPALPSAEVLSALVRRADALLTGVLTGSCLTLLGCVVLLGALGDRTAVILGYLVVAICALRMRMFAAVRHRVPLGLTALLGLSVLLVQGWTAIEPATRDTMLTPLLGVLLLLAGATIAAGGTFARRPPAPGLGRAADIVEVLCVVVTPVFACAVLGLFGLVRSMLNG